MTYKYDWLQITTIHFFETITIQLMLIFSRTGAAVDYTVLQQTNSSWGKLNCF